MAVPQSQSENFALSEFIKVGALIPQVYLSHLAANTREGQSRARALYGPRISLRAVYTMER